MHKDSGDWSTSPFELGFNNGALCELMRVSLQLQHFGLQQNHFQQLIKASLERGLQAELSGHLGYDKGDPIGRFLPNARNGSYPKTLGTSAGDVDLAVPRDRDGSFTPHLVPKGSRRTSGLDDIIISLYAGGMTVRDIAHHLESTLGTELSHETISKITDEVLDEVMFPHSLGILYTAVTQFLGFPGYGD